MAEGAAGSGVCAIGSIVAGMGHPGRWAAPVAIMGVVNGQFGENARDAMAVVTRAALSTDALVTDVHGRAGL